MTPAPELKPHLMVGLVGYDDVSQWLQPLGSRSADWLECRLRRQDL
jgi:hypothetical protein